MYVRLAFAVAAHLEPEILLVDEVLAVGDAEFQRRCLGRMEDLGESGPDGALRLAPDAGGRAALRPRDPARRRAASSATGRARTSSPTTCRPSAAAARRRAWPDLDERARATTSCGCARCASSTRTATPPTPSTSGDPVGIEIGFTVLRRRPSRSSRRSRSSTRAATSRSTRWTRARAGTSRRRPGEYVATAWIPGNLLNEGLDDASTSAICSLGAPKLHPPRGRARRRLVPRAGPGRGRLGARPVHRAVARRRPAAARVDDRGALASKP